MAVPMDYTSSTVVRSYEVVSLLLLVLGILYVWQSRNPVYAGIFLASSIGGGVMEWIFDSKWYFRLTIDHKFVPAWEMAGEVAPVAMVLFYAFFFGIPLIILKDHKASLERSLGKFGTHLFVIALGTFGTPAFECLNTSVTHIYKYHQQDGYLFYGMPYSNFWFGALMMYLPYWALEEADVLIRLIPRTSLTIMRQKLLAVGVGFSAVISAFFLAATINGIWYVKAGDIWTPTTRDF